MDCCLILISMVSVYGPFYIFGLNSRVGNGRNFFSPKNKTIYVCKVYNIQGTQL